MWQDCANLEPRATAKALQGTAWAKKKTLKRQFSKTFSILFLLHAAAAKLEHHLADMCARDAAGLLFRLRLETAPWWWQDTPSISLRRRPQRVTATLNHIRASQVESLVSRTKKVVFHYFSLFFIEFCFEFLLASCFGSSVRVGNPNTCPKLWATPLFAKITASQAPLGHPCTRPLDASGSSWMRRCKAWPSKNPKALFTLTRSDWIRAGQVPLASRCFPRANP